MHREARDGDCRGWKPTEWANAEHSRLRAQDREEKLGARI